MPKLTKTIIEKATAKDKPYFLFDDQLAGFCARITPGGKKTYYVQYMVNKKIKRVSIGAHGIFTTERARNKATIMLGEIKAGADPQKEKSIKRKELFVKDLADGSRKHCDRCPRRPYEFRHQAQNNQKAKTTVEQCYPWHQGGGTNISNLRPGSQISECGPSPDGKLALA